MIPTLQPGTHPDAENLAAFAEQSLPVAERDQIFAHMATCGRCREIIFLAQRALEEEKPEAVSVRAGVPIRLASWLSGWRWAWLPAGAFAAFLGFAIIQHSRHAAMETQLNAKLSQAEPLRDAETPAVAPPSISNSELKPTPSAKPSDVRERAITRADKDTFRQSDQKKSVEQQEPKPEIAASPILVSPGVAGGSFHGTMAARAKGSSLGGPMAANQITQQNMEAQQNAFQQTQNVRQNPAINSAAANVPVTAASESLTVQPQSLPTPAPSALQMQPSNSKVTLDSIEVSPVNGARLLKAPNLALPNGIQTLSTASTPGRTIALDTAGALFLSADGGKHWQLIPTQWTGRAELVRTRPVETQSSMSAGAQTMRFELVNDKLQTWVSIDGKNWTAQPLPLK